MLLSLVMSLLYGLEVVSAPIETFHLWVVVIIVGWLDKRRVSALKFDVVELVRETNVRVVKLSHPATFMDRLLMFLLEVEAQVLILNVLIVGTIAGHSACSVISIFVFELPCHWLRLPLHDVLLVRLSDRLNRGTKGLRMGVNLPRIQLFPSRAMVGLGLRSSLLFLEFILVNRE